MPRSSDARDKAIQTTAKLLCRQGYAATGLTEVLELSGAPKGSFYFHFPGGKEQLATEAIESANGYVKHMIQTTLGRSESPEAAIRALASLFAGWLERSGYVEGCPVTTVTLETEPGSGELADACAASFRSWQESMRQYLELNGYTTDRSARLSSLIMCTLEGAFVLSRSQMSTEPFDTVAELLVELL
jgi:TetR/AcrR family transcriptional repressor of lmrAB and yxaGH operons